MGEREGVGEGEGERVEETWVREIGRASGGDVRGSGRGRASGGDVGERGGVGEGE